MENRKYFKLIDKNHYGTIIRTNGVSHESYDKTSKSWGYNGSLISYFNDKSPLYDLYEEISEKEALTELGV